MNPWTSFIQTNFFILRPFLPSNEFYSSIFYSHALNSNLRILTSLDNAYPVNCFMAVYYFYLFSILQLCYVLSIDLCVARAQTKWPEICFESKDKISNGTDSDVIKMIPISLDYKARMFHVINSFSIPFNRV